MKEEEFYWLLISAKKSEESSRRVNLVQKFKYGSIDVECESVLLCVSIFSTF
jgi:hypothetical protein